MTEPLAPLQFVANLADRQSALILSGRGERLLVELEAFHLNAAIALVGLAQYTGVEFLVTVQPVPKGWTNLDNDKAHKKTNEIAEGASYRVGRRGTGDAGNQQEGGGI